MNFCSSLSLTGSWGSLTRAEAEGSTQFGPVYSEWSVLLSFSDPSSHLLPCMSSPTLLEDRPRVQSWGLGQTWHRLPNSCTSGLWLELIGWGFGNMGRQLLDRPGYRMTKKVALWPPLIRKLEELPPAGSLTAPMKSPDLMPADFIVYYYSECFYATGKNTFGKIHFLQWRALCLFWGSRKK